MVSIEVKQFKKIRNLTALNIKIYDFCKQPFNQSHHDTRLSVRQYCFQNEFACQSVKYCYGSINLKFTACVQLNDTLLLFTLFITLCLITEVNATFNATEVALKEDFKDVNVT